MLILPLWLVLVGAETGPLHACRRGHYVAHHPWQDRNASTLCLPCVAGRYQPLNATFSSYCPPCAAGRVVVAAAAFFLFTFFRECPIDHVVFFASMQGAGARSGTIGRSMSAEEAHAISRRSKREWTVMLKRTHTRPHAAEIASAQTSAGLLRSAMRRRASAIAHHEVGARRGATHAGLPPL